MFFSNKKHKPDNGFFNNVPRDISFVVMSFLADDVKALNHWAMTNSSFQQLVAENPHQIHVKVGNNTFTGTYAQFLNNRKQLLDYQHAVKVVKQQKEDERIKIFEDKTLVVAKKREIKNTWSNNNGSTCSILPEEKACSLFCCLTGTIGGSIVSFFIPWPCFASACVGAAITTPIPLVASRATLCCCNACVQCKAAQINEREETLDARFPEPQFMMR